MSTEQIVAAVGVVIAAIFAWLPGLKDWYDGLPKQNKTWVMTGMSAVVAIGAVGLKCAGVDVGAGAVCLNPSDPNFAQGAWSLVSALVLAAGGAQLGYVGIKTVTAALSKQSPPAGAIG